MQLWKFSIKSVGPQLKFNPSKPSIENFAFKLHYRATVVLLLACVVLVCGREYFGEHIRCISDGGVPEHVIQTYCFFMATFTITLLQSGFLPHPGVGPIAGSDETLHHTYYQWVPFVLFLQSMAFYLPHSIWKKKEGGRVKALVDGLQMARIAIEDDDMQVNGQNIPSRSTLEKRLDIIRKDIVLRLRITRTWSVWLVSMEVANLMNIILQIYLTNKFLNGHFYVLGLSLFNVNWNTIADPLETVFPKVTKCIFHKYGPSGSIQQHDALCVMALNIIHEKIYTLLWFWFFFLLLVSIIAVAWRISTFYLYRRSPRFNEMMFKQVSSSKFDPYTVISVVNGCQFADWLFLYYLAKNMNGFVFQELFKRLAEELSTRDMPFDQDGHEESGATPVLVGRVDYDDETLPLKDAKKAS
ncbi:hypothetical protein JYU34_010732 [Plutella xylostella]|uniref:Innexin n=1 Tax=Plutella xylostella TaxID=51655 RepID=A0ABQ7QF38_PLUXY|nr:hypothetical protein JYU34_010732 [Plutella xylostella]